MPRLSGGIQSIPANSCRRTSSALPTQSRSISDAWASAKRPSDSRSPLRGAAPWRYRRGGPADENDALLAFVTARLFRSGALVLEVIRLESVSCQQLVEIGAIALGEASRLADVTRGGL